MTTQTDKDDIWQIFIVFIECINCLRQINNNTKKKFIEEVRELVHKKGEILEILQIDNTLNTEELLSIPNKITKMNQQINNICSKFENLHSLNTDLAKIVNRNVAIYTMMLDQYKNNKNNKKQYKKNNIKEYENNGNTGKEILNLLIFGYIRKLIEDKYNMMIPFYLKMLCLEFYGNIIMDTNILNINELNTFGYVLKSSSFKKTESEYQYIYTQKIYDSKKDGFNTKLVDIKCGDLNYKSIIIIKTNQNHIIICYQSHGVELRNDGDIPEMIGCLLKSPISTIPMLYHRVGPIYHFPNDFEANFKEKLSDIITQYDSSIIHNIECLETNINDEISIAEFEIFTVQ